MLKKITEVSLTLKIYSQSHILFFSFFVHQTTYYNLLKTRLILEIKFDFEIEIFKVKGVSAGIFLLFFPFSARAIT